MNLYQLARALMDGRLTKAQAEQLAVALVRLSWGASVEQAFAARARDGRRS